MLAEAGGIYSGGILVAAEMPCSSESPVSADPSGVF
jgi:hypothetical protein